MRKIDLLKLLEKFDDNANIMVGHLNEDSVWVYKNANMVDLEKVYFSFYQHAYVVDQNPKDSNDSNPVILIS